MNNQTNILRNLSNRAIRGLTALALFAGMVVAGPVLAVPAQAAEELTPMSHTIDYIVLSGTSNTDFLNMQQLEARTKKVSELWHAMSNGIVSEMTVGTVRTLPNYKGDFCAMEPQNDPDGVISSVLGYSPEIYNGWNNRRHLVVIAAASEFNCPLGGWTTINGHNLSTGGAMTVRSLAPDEDEKTMALPRDAAVIAHELGHVFGLMHAAAADPRCDARSWGGPFYWIASCPLAEYGDDLNLMGGSRDPDRLLINSVQKYMLGVIRPGKGLTDMVPRTDEQFFDIFDIRSQDTSLVQSVRFVTDDPDGAGPCTPPVYQVDYNPTGGGVQIFRVNTATDCGTKSLATANMTVALRGYFWDTFFQPGWSAVTEDGKVQIRVVSVDDASNTAKVGIRRTDDPAQPSLNLLSNQLDSGNRYLSDSTGNQAVVVVTTNQPAWSASSDQSWVAVTPSGTNEQDLVLTVESNPTADRRTATVTVTAGSASDTISVEQGPGPVQDDCGDNYAYHCLWQDVSAAARGNIETPGDKDTYWFTATVTGTWTFTVSGTPGLPDPVGKVYFTSGFQDEAPQTGSPSGNQEYLVSVRLTAGEPYLFTVSGTGDSTGTYTISATRPQAGISLWDNASKALATWSPSGNGDGIYMDVVSNGPWRLGELPDWLHVDYTSGPRDQSVTLVADPNTGGQPRKWTMEFTAQDKTATVTVDQPAGVVPAEECGYTPATACTQANLSSAAHTRADYPGDRDWFKIVPDESGQWSFASSGIVVSAILYADDGVTMVAWTDNPNKPVDMSVALTAGRTYYLAVTPTGYRTGPYALAVAPPGRAVLLATQDTVTLSDTGDRTTVRVTTNTSWQLKVPDWIKASCDSGTGTTYVVLTASPNTTRMDRNGEAEFTGAGLKAVVSLSQPAPGYNIAVSPGSWTVRSSGDSTDIHVTTTADWQLTLPDWITASRTSGSGDATVTLTAAANTTGATRTGTVVVSGPDKQAEMSVTQDTQPVNPGGCGTTKATACRWTDLSTPVSGEIKPGGPTGYVLTADKTGLVRFKVSATDPGFRLPYAIVSTQEDWIIATSIFQGPATFWIYAYVEAGKTYYLRVGDRWNGSGEFTVTYLG